MPTYKFQARRVASGAGIEGEEEVVEWGTAVARSEADVREKLRRRGLDPVKIREIRGIKGFFARFRADIK